MSVLATRVATDKWGEEYVETKLLDIDSPEYDEFLGLSPIPELEYEAPTITVTPVPELSEEEQIIQDEIRWAQGDFAEGATDMVKGSLQMTEALVRLREGDLYLQSPLVTHYETRPGWKDYLRELVAHTKEVRPEVQISMSGLTNALWRYKVLVGVFGIEKDKALGAHETIVRKIRSMARFDYKTGEPLGLKDGFLLDKLPVPGDCPEGEELKEGLRAVINDAVAQPIISTKMFDEYKSGTGQVETKVGIQVKIGEEGQLVGWTAFVEKFNKAGEAMEDYAVNLLTGPWPCEVADKLIDLGWNVEFD